MNKKEYKVLIFDLDDTLIDNLENVRFAFKTMLEYLRKTYTDEEFDRWYNFDKEFWIDFYDNKFDIPYERNDDRFVPYVQSLRYLMFFNYEFNLDEALKINELFLHSLKSVIVPVDGVYETLKYLSNKYDIIVATNGPRQASSVKLDKIKCLSFIKYVFSADMTKECVTKPNKIFFDELLDYIDYYDKDKILIIGDSLRSEVLGGMNSNIDSCWFNRFNEKLDNKYQPTIVINKLLELKNIL